MRVFGRTDKAWLRHGCSCRRRSRKTGGRTRPELRRTLFGPTPRRSPPLRCRISEEFHEEDIVLLALLCGVLMRNLAAIGSELAAQRSAAAAGGAAASRPVASFTLSTCVVIGTVPQITKGAGFNFYAVLCAPAATGGSGPGGSGHGDLWLLRSAAAAGSTPSRRECQALAKELLKIKSNSAMPHRGPLSI